MLLKRETQTLLLLLILTIHSTHSADILSLVYKGCANQNLNNGGSSQQSLSTLSSSLISKSASTRFYKTTTSSTTGQQIFGLFQCRGDLSNNDCAACVQNVLPKWTSLCSNSVAARVQFTGCYALYQVQGFPQVSGTQMLFKTCGSGSAGDGFEEKRDTAFSNLQNGMATANNGFYATSYQSVYVMAQCEGDLSATDCGQCVSQAVQKSEVECGGASSGQVYLDKCYISYNYYPNGVPHGGDGGGLGGGGLGVGGGGQTGKTVAIVVGGAAGVGFLVICLLFARNLMKKKDDDY